MRMIKFAAFRNPARRLALLTGILAPIVLGLSGCGMMVDAGKKFLAAEHYNRAVEAHLHHEDAKARQELQRTLALDPDHPEANLMMAQYYVDDHDWLKASACIEKITAHKRFQSLPYLFTLADLYDRAGKLDLAEKYYRKAFWLRPFDPETQNNLGYFLANHNMKLNEALPLIVKAVKAQPNVGAYVDSLGWVYYRLGKLDDAERKLLRAHTLASKSPEIHYHLGIVFRDRKKLDDARTEFRHACDLNPNFKPARDELLKLGESKIPIRSGKLDSRNR